MGPEPPAVDKKLRGGPRPRAGQGRRSGIINPEGTYIAGPVYDKETIVYGEIDLDQIVLRKAAVDVNGKDSRWDIMRIETNARPYMPFTGSFGTQLWEEMQGNTARAKDAHGARSQDLLARVENLERELAFLKEKLDRNET